VQGIRFGALGMIASSFTLPMTALALASFPSLFLGDLLLVGAVILAAIGYAEGGLLAREIGSWQTISWALVVALPAMIPVALISLPAISAHVTPQAWLGFAYIAIISMYLGFFAWYRGLAIGPMVWIAAAAVFILAGTAVWARVKSLVTA
jgi:drug/metabolite transporter (DMT)-like permease